VFAPQSAGSKPVINRPRRGHADDEGEEDGIFRFGRPIGDDEAVLWPADRLKRKIADY
jgi:hypothetical protein